MNLLAPPKLKGSPGLKLPKRLSPGFAPVNSEPVPPLLPPNSELLLAKSDPGFESFFSSGCSASGFCSFLEAVLVSGLKLKLKDPAGYLPPAAALWLLVSWLKEAAKVRWPSGLPGFALNAAAGCTFLSLESTGFG